MIDILNQFWRAFLYWDGQRISGLAVTLWLLVASIGIGFVTSIPLAVARVSRKRWLSTPVRLYTYVFRGTPLYVQLLLIYTGIYSLEFVRSHALLDSFFRSGFHCAILAFALNTCAYTTEIFAGAIRALPLYSNEVILMLHATTVAFTATVPDVLKVARDANSATYRSFEAFGLAALIYLAVSFALVALFRRAERHWLAYLAVRR